jgi:hypothetical protein
MAAQHEKRLAAIIFEKGLNQISPEAGHLGKRHSQKIEPAASTMWSPEIETMW